MGQVEPPTVASPPTVEPSKPRLCLDLRYINNWMRDTPFVLETLAELPRIVQPRAYMSKPDDKSGYKNIWGTVQRPVKKSWASSGVFFWFVANTISFGWTNAVYCYSMLNGQVEAYLRLLGVPILTCISDDRWIEQWRGKEEGVSSAIKGNRE